MRLERWNWFLLFCLLSIGVHIGLAVQSRSFALLTPRAAPPAPATLEVTLQAIPPEPPPAPKPEVKPTPRPETDFGKRVVTPPKLADTALQPTHHSPVEPVTQPETTTPVEHVIRQKLVHAPQPLPQMTAANVEPGGEDKLKDEKPIALGSPDAPKTPDAPKRTQTARADTVLKVSKNEGGGSPAPDKTLTGKNGAAGPETPTEDVVYTGGGAGGQKLPKAPAKIGGGGGASILSVNNPLAKEVVPDDKPGLGPGAGGGAGTGNGGGAGFRVGKGIGTRRDGKDALATLNSKPGNGVGAGQGSNIGTKAPGGGKGAGAEMPGTGGEGTGYGKGKGIDIGNGSLGHSGVGQGSSIGRLTGGGKASFGDLSGLLRGDPNGGGGANGGPGGNGRGPGSGFGSVQQTPFSLKGDIYLLPVNTDKLPDFSMLTPIGSIYATELNIPTRHWDKGFPGVTDRFEWFGIDYNGTFTLKKATNFKFRLTSDDGSKLFIDDQLIIDSDGLHSTLMKEGSASLLRGKHKIRVQYFQGPKDEIALVLEVMEQ